MGRIRVFLCAFCLDRNSDKTANEHTFNRDIDVSHLATPHISSNLSTPACSTPVCEGTANNNNDESRPNNNHHQPLQHHHNHFHHRHQEQALALNHPNQALEIQLHHDRADNSEEGSSHHSQHQDNGRPQPSPQVSGSSPLNAPSPALDPQHQRQQHQNIMNIQALQHQQQALAYDLAGPAGYRGATRLSYDIISVREPLAKILVERQQQLQRQNLGDHDYIEVYGERGSSCFYEEIAGSTTSSATYDQIGANSNHNYQVLVNAYAVIANRPNGFNQNENDDRLNQNASSSLTAYNRASNAENHYDFTHPSDQVDAPSTCNRDPQPSCSSAQYNGPSTSHQATMNEQTNSQPNPVPADRTSIIAESIPVYSVINKATRRSNAIIRATIDSCRPPQPPPKNLMMVHQPSTSAIQFYKDSSELASLIGNNRSSPQIPTTSSYSKKNNNISEFNENSDRPTRLPQPPPRLSKFGALKSSTNRPLPLPDNLDLDNASATDRNQPRDYDIESINNGYELLETNVFDDDQIDVGYERIRESNRYSGGSLSMQFRPLQALDNGGYESVHPIYSSPSNALVEPNYEAIGPATASELAAAATARLTAAAATLEQFIRQDQ